MKPIQKATLAFAALILPGTTAAAAQATEACAAMDQVMRLARNDFPSLRTLNMKPGICALRPTEFRCRWNFPGDAFAMAEAQAQMLNQCAAVKSAEAPRKLRRGETAVALESDLWVIVPKPAVDMGQWSVVLRIVAASDPGR
jgi:hypothetical protein